MSRSWHAVLALVILASLGIQVALLLGGGQDVNSGQSSAHLDLVTRFTRLFSYFTIQSNLVVLGVAVSLVLDPRRDGPFWRVARLDSLIGIAITGIVFVLLLSGLVQHSGPSAWANAGFHYVSPALTLAGWAFFGPRSRITWTVVGWAFAWPGIWIVFTLVRGALTGVVSLPVSRCRRVGLRPRRPRCRRDPGRGAGAVRAPAGPGPMAGSKRSGWADALSVGGTCPAQGGD